MEQNKTEVSIWKNEDDDDNFFWGTLYTWNNHEKNCS